MELQHFGRKAAADLTKSIDLKRLETSLLSLRGAHGRISSLNNIFGSFIDGLLEIDTPEDETLSILRNRLNESLQRQVARNQYIRGLMRNVDGVINNTRVAFEEVTVVTPDSRNDDTDPYMEYIDDELLKYPEPNLLELFESKAESIDYIQAQLDFILFDALTLAALALKEDGQLDYSENVKQITLDAFSGAIDQLKSDFKLAELLETEKLEFPDLKEDLMEVVTSVISQNAKEFMAKKNYSAGIYLLVLDLFKQELQKIEYGETFINRVSSNDYKEDYTAVTILMPKKDKLIDENIPVPFTNDELKSIQEYLSKTYNFRKIALEMNVKYHGGLDLRSAEDIINGIAKTPAQFQRLKRAYEQMIYAYHKIEASIEDRWLQQLAAARREIEACI